jgi:ATP-dependent Clp protease ATP-binding subunit ClpX
VGRLPVISALTPLDAGALVRVLTEPKNALVKQYQRLFSMENADLQFTDEALQTIAHKAQVKETGARGLRSIIEEVMLDIMFSLPDEGHGSRYIINKDVVEGRKPKFPIIEPKNKSA